MVNENKIFSFKIKRQAKNVFLRDVERTVAYNAINKMQSSKVGQEGKKRVIDVKGKKKKYFIGMIHTNGEGGD